VLTPDRFNMVVPTFESIYSKKSKALHEERSQYLQGIKRLENANKTIDGLQVQLEKLGPELVDKEKEVEEGMKLLERETKEVEVIERAVGLEAAAMQSQKDEAETIKRECELHLNEAMPLYESAIQALRTLKVNDFVLMKSFNQPPQPIRVALEAACIMLGIKPKMVDQVVNKSGVKAKVPDYWVKSKKLLNDYKKFLSSMEHYDKDNIPHDRIVAIGKYLNDPDFEPAKIRKASEAAEGICKWVIALCKYNIVAKQIAPKREALKMAQEKLANTEAAFMVKQGEYQQIIERRDDLIAAHHKKTAEKQALIERRDKCVVQLQRAS